MSIFEPEPGWEFREHAQDIIDISWCSAATRSHQSDKVLLLSCSFDQKVILWNLQSENNLALQIFEHPDVPAQISFCPDNPQIFVSGSLDGAVRVWSIDRK